MEYISAEEFLKQPKEIQKLFIEWWQCEIGDLFAFDSDDDRDLNILQVVGSENQKAMTKANKGGSRIPLFVEGQLRQFIEDKTGCKLDIEYFSTDSILFRFRIGRKERKSHMFYDTKSLIQAYWKVALEIAKEKVQQ